MKDISSPEITVELAKKNPLFDDVTQKSQTLLFSSHNERFGLEIKYIKRVETLGTITKVPRTPAYIEGIINLRGTINTLIEFSKFSTKSTKGLSNPGHVIILEHPTMNLGLIVEMIHDVIYIPIDQLEENENLPADLEHAFIKNITRVQGQIINIIHAEKIFKEIAECDFSQFEGNIEIH